MLINASKLINFPVLSLQVGGAIAKTEFAVIDPDDLKIIAFLVGGPLVDNETGDVLDVRSIRELSKVGMIVDSADELASRDDIVKIKDVLELNFSLIGLKVKTKKGHKLGKVIDYSVNSDNLMVQQLIVQRPAIKSLLDPELVIGRSQIVEVNDYEIIVKDEEAKIKKEAATKDFVPNFVNPFREQSFSPAHSQSPDEQDTE